mgnify:FL=1
MVLCANSKPVLNDVTADELRILVGRLRTLDPILDQAMESGSLVVMDTGQASPCLDLR